MITDTVLISRYFAIAMIALFGSIPFPPFLIGVVYSSYPFLIELSLELYHEVLDCPNEIAECHEKFAKPPMFLIYFSLIVTGVCIGVNVFNHRSRRSNFVRTSVVNLVCQILRLVTGFVYRALFLRILAVEYLGINGLFSNILGILNLSEMGITSAIRYRLYKPISSDNAEQVGRLMRFYKKVYRYIALVVLVLGVIVSFFLRYLIRDSGEIPGDINLFLAFWLFLVQITASYLYSYRISLLSADQKQYVETWIHTSVTVLINISQIVCLTITRSYMDALFAGTLCNLVLYFVASGWVARQYPQVFSVREDISVPEKKAIYKDTRAAALHRIGGVVLSSTDQILISKYIGLALTGIYSNYLLITSSISNMIGALFGGISASFGSILSTEDEEKCYKAFSRALFLNLWIVGAATTCLYVLTDDFIVLWLKKDLLLDPLTVVLLCVLFYIQGARAIPAAYTEANGLFLKDRTRPIIEAALNLAISLIALHYIGVAGIILGTIVSCLLTVFWRIPWLLYRYAFRQKKISSYWLMYCKYTVITLVSAYLSIRIKTVLFQGQVTVLNWLLAGYICVTVYLGLHFLLFGKSCEFQYFCSLAREKITVIMKKDNPN